MQLKQSVATFIKTKYLVFIFLLLAVLFFAAFVFMSSYFQIKDIVVTGKNQTLYGLENIRNRNILLTSSHSIEDELYERNPQIETITVSKQYPSTIEITVELTEPIAYLETKGGFIQLGKNGRILAKTTKAEKDIPVIHYYQSIPYQTYQAGQLISFKDILYTLFFADELKGLGVHINKVDITGFYMLRLYSDKEQSFVTTTDKDRDVQARELDEIIKQFKLKGQAFKVLDVRFDKPVVTF